LVSNNIKPLVLEQQFTGGYLSVWWAPSLSATPFLAHPLLQRRGISPQIGIAQKKNVPLGRNLGLGRGAYILAFK
jgi:hypothetical protein